VAPCFAGRPPIVPVTGLGVVVGLGCFAGALAFCSHGHAPIVHQPAPEVLKIG